MNWKMAQRAEKMNPSVIREILKVTEKPGIISFAGGLPSPKTFPVEAFAAACAKVLETDGRAALQYAASEGYAPLRQWVADSLPWAVDPEQVLITTGSQQALDLIAKILIDAGSRVLVETPTYLGALQAFTPMEPLFVSISGDDNGLDLQDLEAKAAGARFLYVLPNFQNPTGNSMSEASRAALSATAARLGLPLVEDNPYGDLWFDSPPPLPLTARNPDGCIYMGSFSKTLAPGLRLGFLVAPKALYPKLLQAKQAADLHTPSFNQRIAYEVLKDGFLSRHVPAIRALYKAQRDAMLAALAREMPADVSWNQPAGGMFLWARLPEGMNAVELLVRAVEKNVAFVPGAAFYAENADVRSLRLSFVTASAAQIDIGVKALAAAIGESRRGQASAAPMGDRKHNAVSDGGGSPGEQGPQDWLRQTAGAGLRDAALLHAVQACTAGPEPRHAAPSGGRELREANDRGGTTSVGEPSPQPSPKGRGSMVADASPVGVN